MGTLSESTNKIDMISQDNGNFDPVIEEGKVEGFNIDPVKEAKVVRKLDLFITPVLFVAYLAYFIGRANIGRYSRGCVVLQVSVLTPSL